jgi:hypothetical protein
MKNFRRYSKITAINLLILLSFLISLETLTSLIRFALQKSFVGYVARFNLIEAYQELNNPCRRMETHPLLGHMHSSESCEIKDGFSRGQYVFYGDKEQKTDLILTLGGSTTDGFYQKISNGITWPNALSKILDKNNSKLSVINGGVGGYDSSQELIKLLLDLPRINREKNVKFIISLNGINELPGYRFVTFSRDLRKNETLSYRFPLLNGVHMKMITSKKYIDLSAPNFVEFFPSLNSALLYISKKFTSNNSSPSSIKLDKSLKLYELPFGKNTNPDPYEVAADQWLYNVKTINAISQAHGAKYYLFLQPTMGLHDYQLPLKSILNDYLIYKKAGGGSRFKEINLLYKSLKERCSRLDFCLDISKIAPPTGENYYDPRHHNENGNKIIAENIFNYITKK